MENIHKATARRFGTIIMALAVLASVAGAKDRPVNPTDVPANVIAHLPLPHAAGNQMLLQRDNGKNYLYVQQASKQGFMIVDVTRPDRPNLLKRTAAPSESTAGNLEIISPDVAIAEAPEKTPTTLASSNRPTQIVRVLDMSDPHNPRTLQEFSGVTSLLPDGGHGLIYVTNDEGLWILRYNRPALLEPSKTKPPCDSYSAIMSMPPDCE